MAEQKVFEEVSDFANATDYEAWHSKLFPLWEKLLPHVIVRPGVLVIVMGCNMHFGAFPKLKEELFRRGAGLKVNPARRGTRPVDPASMYPNKKVGKKLVRTALQRIPWLKRTLFRDTTPQRIQGVTLSYHASRHGDSGLQLLPLYIHHRLMVLRVE